MSYTTRLTTHRQPSTEEYFLRIEGHCTGKTGTVSANNVLCCEPTFFSDLSFNSPIAFAMWFWNAESTIDIVFVLSTCESHTSHRALTIHFRFDSIQHRFLPKSRSVATGVSLFVCYTPLSLRLKPLHSPSCALSPGAEKRSPSSDSQLCDSRLQYVSMVKAYTNDRVLRSFPQE